MKRWLLIILMVVGFGCSNQNEIEVIKLDEGYREYSAQGIIRAKIISDEQAQKMVEELNTIANQSSIDEYDFFFESVIFINEGGRIDKMIILTSAGKNFDDAIIQKMGTWKFKPLVENGVEVKYRMRYLVSFHKNEDGKFNVVSSSLPLPQNINGNMFYTAADEMPEPIGGMKAIQEKVSYPAEAKKSKIQGRVFVRAYIDKEGKVIQTELIRGIGGGCNEAALEAIKATAFKPGRLDGAPVNVQVTVPILFSLK